MNKNDYDELYAIIKDHADVGNSIGIFLKNNKEITINFPGEDNINGFKSVSHVDGSQIITIRVYTQIFDDEVSINLNEIIIIREYSNTFKTPGIYMNEEE